MSIRHINLENEYTDLTTWWTDRLLVAPPKVILQGAKGFMSCNDSHLQEYAMAWMYLCDRGGVCFIEWCTSNPKSSITALEMGTKICELYAFMELYAKKLNFRVLLSTAPDGSSLRKTLVNGGWTQCEGPAHVLMAKGLQ